MSSVVLLGAASALFGVGDSGYYEVVFRLDEPALEALIIQELDLRARSGPLGTTGLRIAINQASANQLVIRIQNSQRSIESLYEIRAASLAVTAREVAVLIDGIAQIFAIPTRTEERPLARQRTPLDPEPPPPPSVPIWLHVGLHSGVLFGPESGTSAWPVAVSVELRRHWAAPRLYLQGEPVRRVAGRNLALRDYGVAPVFAVAWNAESWDTSAFAGPRLRVTEAVGTDGVGNRRLQVGVALGTRVGLDYGLRLRERLWATGTVMVDCEFERTRYLLGDRTAFDRGHCDGQAWLGLRLRFP